MRLDKPPDPFELGARRVLQFRHRNVPNEAAVGVAELLEALSDLVDLGQPDPSAVAAAQAAFDRAAALRRRWIR